MQIEGQPFRPDPHSSREAQGSTGTYALKMFGTMTFEGRDCKLTKFATKRSALILARLAVSREQKIGRDELAELLWPDEYLDQTRLRLRQELLRLRQALGQFGTCLRTDRNWVELESGLITTDVLEFDSCLASAAIAQDVHAKIASLTQAVSLLRGPFLAGQQDPWVQATRRSYGEKGRFAWLTLAESLQSTGAHGKALEATHNAVMHDPLDSVANTMLVRRLIERGQTARAREAFREFDALMLRELGTHAPPSARAQLEWIDSDPMESMTVEAQVRSRVIRPMPLFGRDDLLDAVAGCISRKGSAVAVVGMIGVGKTHLIHEIAWRFTQFSDERVQFGGDPDQVTDGLYVIDEQVDRASLITIMEQARSLGWRVLAESRIRLDCVAFQEITINPLATPHVGDSTETIYANPSVQLLMAQVARQTPASASATEAVQLSEIVRHLDGLPSALKAFSYRLMVETPGQILKRFERGLVTLIENKDLDGESIESHLNQVVSELPEHAISGLAALSILDGASADLASELAAPHEFSEVWRLLEKQSLITVQGLGEERRLRVANPIGFAIRKLVKPETLATAEAKTWRVLGDWAYRQSRRQSGEAEEIAFSLLAAEMENLRRGISWAIDHEPALAAHLVVGTWRTVCARGQPSRDGLVLFRAANAGAHLIAPIFGGEAWTGTGITLSVCAEFEKAEHAFLEAIATFELGGDPDCIASVAWAKLNLAGCVISHSDKTQALEIIRQVVEEAENPELKLHAQTDYAAMLASTGVIGESLTMGEATFAIRLQSKNPTVQARAYVDLGELYQAAGRTEAARPLTLEGIRRLREAGVQYFLVDQLVYLAKIVASDPVVDWGHLNNLVQEATVIANRIGSKPIQCDLARLALLYESRQGDRESLIRSIEHAFQLVQSFESSTERKKTQQVLAQELTFHGRLRYANTILHGLGESSDLQCIPGWLELLATDSHATICVLSVVLAKEAFPT